MTRSPDNSLPPDAPDAVTAMGTHPPEPPDPPDSPPTPAAPYPLETSDIPDTPQADENREPPTGPEPGTSPAPEGGAPKWRRRLPPSQRDRLVSLLALVMCLIAAATPLLIELEQPALIHVEEAQAMAISSETWRQHNALADDSWNIDALVPWYNGREQHAIPPGLTWLHLMSFQSLDPDHATPTQLIHQARRVSVLFTLLAVTAVFWAGLSIGGLTPATLAALVCAAMPPLLFHGRLASADIPAMSLALLSIAAAIWAIRPLKLPPSLSRQALGWTLCGLSLGLAILTGGLLLLPTVALPLLLILALYPNRLSHSLGGVAAFCIAALLLTPWALYVHARDPDIWQTWVSTLIPAYMHGPGTMINVFSERLALLLLVLLPWTAWLIGGLVQPFSTSSAGSRLRMLLGWAWFVPVVLTLLFIPGRGTVGELMLVMPAAALLAGQLFRQFVNLAQEGRNARLWRLLCWPHIAVLLAASFLLPAAAVMQETLAPQFWWFRATLTPMPLSYWIGAAVALVMLTGLSARFVVRHYPGRAVVCWAFWVIVACSVVSAPLARGPLMRSSLPEEVAALTTIVGDAPLYFYPATTRPLPEQSAPQPALLFYTSQLTPPPRGEGHALRTLPIVTPRQIEQAQREEPVLFVLTPSGLSPGLPGFVLTQHLHEAKATLWMSRSQP